MNVRHVCNVVVLEHVCTVAAPPVTQPTAYVFVLPVKVEFTRKNVCVFALFLMNQSEMVLHGSGIRFFCV